MKTHLYIFTNDLRVKDNPALTAAASCERLAATYILDDLTPKARKMGAAQRWWLHKSLEALSEEIPLILREGRFVEKAVELALECKAEAVFMSRCYEPWMLEGIEKLEKLLAKEGIALHTFNGTLLVEPWEVKPQSSPFFKVYTPFYRAALATTNPLKPKFKPRLPDPVKGVKSQRLPEWELLPTNPDWSKGFHWEPGEKGAAKKWSAFLKEGIVNYDHERDRPDLNLTSRLSPHLHFGEISLATLWHDLPRGKGAEVYLKELFWREFCYHLLYHFPTLPSENFNPQFDQFKWEKNRAHFKAWKKGMTGYPIVDAGMRQLWSEGWMHNRVRMITASFLTKDLLIDWREGEAYFWDTLVDADLANNAGGWQWAFGSGADASPFFRIFNPTLQGEKFDPDGEYVRKWVPELKSLPDELIHTPWLSDKKFDYPSPIIDHDEARKKALAVYKK